jgi:hypothetical protein
MKRETITRHGRTFTVHTLNPETPRKRSARAVEFVKLPAVWANKLRGQNGRVYEVAIQLLFLNFKSYKRSFKLTNLAVERLTMSRWAKLRALKKLEQLGLISVEWRVGKAPLVTIIAK